MPDETTAYQLEIVDRVARKEGLVGIVFGNDFVDTTRLASAKSMYIASFLFTQGVFSILKIDSTLIPLVEACFEDM